MTEKVKKEVEEIIKEYKSQVSVSYIRAFEDQKFESQAFWQSISQFQILSEDFIRDFRDKISLGYLSSNQKINVSEEFRKGIKNGKILPPPIKPFSFGNRVEMLDL